MSQTEFEGQDTAQAVGEYLSRNLAESRQVSELIDVIENPFSDPQEFVTARERLFGFGMYGLESTKERVFQFLLDAEALGLALRKELRPSESAKLGLPPYGKLITSDGEDILILG